MRFARFLHAFHKGFAKVFIASLSDETSPGKSFHQMGESPMNSILCRTQPLKPHSARRDADLQ